MTTRLPTDFSKLQVNTVPERPRVTISPAEMQVWRLYAEGYSTAEIAAIRHNSVKTIESHRAHLLRKTGARNAVDLCRAAIVKGIVRLPAEAALS